MLACLLACASFHFCALEQYYTGSINFGKFNPIFDGSLVIILCFIVMGIVGNDFWTYTFGKHEKFSVRVVDIVIGGIDIINCYIAWKA